MKTEFEGKAEQVLCKYISYYKNLQVFSGKSSESLQKRYFKTYIERYFNPLFRYPKYLKISLADYKEKIGNYTKYLEIKI